MAGDFSAKEYVAQGFLSGLFSNPSVKKAAIDINNFLSSSKNITDINDEVISGILLSNGIKSLDKLSNELNEIYKQHLMFCFIDRNISEEDAKELAHIRQVLNINEKRHCTIANSIIRSFISSLTESERVSPDDALLLDLMITQFGSDYRRDEYIFNNLERYKLYWQIENGYINPVACNINLQKDENCFLKMSANLFEFTTITKKIKHKGHSIGLRILPGISIGFGGGKSKVVTKDIMKKIDSGTFYITNQRMIFYGRHKNNAFRLGDILDIEINTNGLRIVDNNGYNPTYEIAGDNTLLGLIVKRIISEYNTVN